MTTILWNIKKKPNPHYESAFFENIHEKTISVFERSIDVFL